MVARTTLLHLATIVNYSGGLKKDSFLKKGGAFWLASVNLRPSYLVTSHGAGIVLRKESQKIRMLLAA